MSVSLLRWGSGMKWASCLMAIVAAAMLSMAAGCNDDRSSNSPPAETSYNLVVNVYAADSSHTDNLYLLTVSGNSDTVVDSQAFSDMVTDMTFAPDGKRAFFINPHRGHKEVYLTDWPVMDTRARYDTISAEGISLSEDGQYLLTSLGAVVLLSASGLAPRYIDSLGLKDACFLPRHSAFCGHYWQDTVVIVDYGQVPADIQRLGLPAPSGEAWQIEAICTTPGGDSLVIATYDQMSAKNYIVVARTNTLSILSKVEVEPDFHWSRPICHPNGQRVYWYYRGSSWPEPVSGAVYCYRIPTGELTAIVDESVAGVIEPIGMALAPDGVHLYVVCINDLFKIYLPTNQVTRLLPDKYRERLAMNVVAAR